MSTIRSTRVVTRVSTLAVAVAVGLVAPASPASAGPQIQPVVTPIGATRPAPSLRGIDRADLSASIDWNGDHVVFLSRPGTGTENRVVRLSSSGSQEIPGTALSPGVSQPNHLTARRIGMMVYLVIGSNDGTWRFGTSYDGGQNFFWDNPPMRAFSADLFGCPVIADVYGGPMLFLGYARWTSHDYGIVAMWPNATAPNISSWATAIVDSAGDPDRPNSQDMSFCPRASITTPSQEIHVFSVKTNSTTSASTGRHAVYTPAGGWFTEDFAPGASGELARGMSASTSGNDVWVSWNRGSLFHVLIGGSNNEETWAQRWTAGRWIGTAQRVMGTGRVIPGTGQLLPTALRNILEGNIYNSQCVAIVRGMPVVVAGEALNGVLVGTRWNGLSVSNLDPVLGWSTPRIQLQNNSSVFSGSLIECQVINGRLSVGAKDVTGGYRFQVYG